MDWALARSFRSALRCSRAMWRGPGAGQGARSVCHVVARRGGQGAVPPPRAPFEVFSPARAGPVHLEPTQFPLVTVLAGKTKGI